MGCWNQTVWIGNSAILNLSFHHNHISLLTKLLSTLSSSAADVTGPSVYCITTLYPNHIHPVAPHFSRLGSHCKPPSPPLLHRQPVRLASHLASLHLNIDNTWSHALSDAASCKSRLNASILHYFCPFSFVVYHCIIVVNWYFLVLRAR